MVAVITTALRLWKATLVHAIMDTLYRMMDTHALVIFHIVSMNNNYVYVVR